MPPHATSERLARLLALITYLSDNPGVPVAEVAAHFGVGEAQVLSDVNLLWVAGTPGYFPDDLIDFSYDAFERGLITLTDPREMHRPLRLGPTEAIALLAALRSLEQLPGLPEEAAVASARAKLTAAAGEAAAAATAVDVRLPRPREGDLLAALRGAVRQRRMVHLRYVSGADVVTERDVDPGELFNDGERWFLRAWCHRVDDVRHFRLDRVLRAEVLDLAAEEHPELRGRAERDATGAEPALSAEDPLVTLELAARSRWVAEGLPVESIEAVGADWVRVRLRVVSENWIRSLVLALGADVRTVRPSPLARSIAETARAAAREYERLGRGEPEPAAGG